ncbi:MAG: recombination mediator RecR [Syntrophorhabdales bacterium]|jgi:recombination protein RecR
MYYPEPIERLVEHLSRLPGIGRKTATRLAFFLLNSRPEYVAELARSIAEVKERIRLCTNCFNITDIDPCRICRDEKRARDTLCVVEDPSHMMVIEAAFPGVYRYHILHGVINPIDGIGPNEIRIPEMRERIAKESIRELIIATNPTIEGNTTAHYIVEMTKSFNLKISRIASGIPIGGDIVYIDSLTIKSAIDNRRSLKEDRS